jgi:hypothetical protein
MITHTQLDELELEDGGSDADVTDPDEGAAD